MLTFDIDHNLIFSVPNRAIKDEINIKNNRIPEAPKHSNDSTLTNEDNEENSSLTSRVNIERLHNSTDGQVEGSTLMSTSHNKRKKLGLSISCRGGLLTTQADVEGEHHTTNPLG